MSKTIDILNRLREKGFSQTEIAKRTGIAQPRLSRWASGRVPAGADDALALLELEHFALNLPKGQLVALPAPSNQGGANA